MLLLRACAFSWGRTEPGSSASGCEGNLHLDLQRTNSLLSSTRGMSWGCRDGENRAVQKPSRALPPLLCLIPAEGKLCPLKLESGRMLCPGSVGNAPEMPPETPQERAFGAVQVSVVALCILTCNIQKKALAAPKTPAGQNTALAVLANPFSYINPQASQEGGISLLSPKSQSPPGPWEGHSPWGQQLQWS